MIFRVKHNKKRICRITDELMTYLFTMGATDITVNVKEDERQFIIKIRSDFVEFTDQEVNRLFQRLNIERQVEMEEYYWELAGESDVDTELTLVGMMTDKGEINFIDDNTIEITLFRYKY